MILLLRAQRSSQAQGEETRQSVTPLGPALVNDASSVEDSEMVTVNTVRAVTVQTDQLRLNAKACCDASVAAGEIGQAGGAGGVERRLGTEAGDPVIGGLDSGASLVVDDELVGVEAEGGEVGREGERLEVFLEVVEAGDGGGEVGETEVRCLFETVSERDSDKG